MKLKLYIIQILILNLNTLSHKFELFFLLLLIVFKRIIKPEVTLHE